VVPPSVTLRNEEPDDRLSIGALVAAAFASPPHADLVDELRSSPSYVPELSVVAEDQDALVGFVMITHATLVAPDATITIANLSPLAILPGCQSQGVGSALMRDIVSRADNLGEPAIVLEGDPGFYGRFGFEPAADHGIELPLPAWASPEAGQVRRLRAYDPSVRGRVVYPAPFRKLGEA
jgi:putative acetyltransferase